ncbi:proline dehydrogenase family protein [bacterium]|nr:proline dehydrogenase family protein [bacterium]
MSLLGRLVLAVTRWGWVRRLFTSHAWGRRVAMRFVAGESLDDAVAATRRLNEEGFTVSLDHLGEHVDDPSLAERARDDYLACIDRIAAEGLDANISVKLTQLGMGLDDELATLSLLALAGRAAAHGLTVTVDMEESGHTGVTLDIVERVQKEHGNLGVALQAYLHRTAEDLARVLSLDGHIRLCKGAYDEPDDVALRSRSDVDEAFDALLGPLMAAEESYPAIATHDEARVAAAVAAGEGRSNPFEFQMLYGIRGAMQRELNSDGHRVRVYVPYGDAWYPYLTRRIAERPSNVWFFTRALFGR